MIFVKSKNKNLTDLDYQAFLDLVSFDTESFAQVDKAKTSLLIGFDEVGRGCIAGPVCTAAYSARSFYNPSKSFFEELRLSLQSGEDPAVLLLDDSKRVPHALRDSLCSALLDISSPNIFYSVNFQPASKIDSDGIVAAIYYSMALNLLEIVLQYYRSYNRPPDQIILLVDGSKTIPNLTGILNSELNKQKIPYLLFEEKNLNPNQGDLFGKETIVLRQKNIIRGDSLSASIAAASNIAKQARDKHMKELGSACTLYDWSKNVGYGTRRHLEALRTHGLSPEHRKSFLTNHQ